MTNIFRAFAVAVVIAPLVFAGDKPPSPRLPDADRIRIAEAFRLADKLGNRLWPDWNKAPFAVLLVTQEHEFLVRHAKPSDDFQLIGDDAILNQKVWYRRRRFDPKLLATFPAVGGVPTIVIGQAENTQSKDSSRWVITLLHEHLHQLQYSQPRYYADVDSLGLARGDQTGMWMLNYPFPYGDAEVKKQFAALRQALAAALKAKGAAELDAKHQSYLDAKAGFRAALKADDYKYFAFQIWQEGIARYTELRLALLAAEGYKPSKRFAGLKDYRSFAEVASEIRRGIDQELQAVDLAKAKRTVVYNFGAAEGLLLDRVQPGWRKDYLKERFAIDKHFRR